MRRVMVVLALIASLALLSAAAGTASAAELILTNEQGTNLNEQALEWESSNLTITTSGSATAAHASRARAHAASSVIWKLLEHWKIVDLPAWELVAGPGLYVFENNFSAGLQAPGQTATLESFNTGGQMVPWLGTVNVTGTGSLKAITPKMRFVMVFPSGASCAFAAGKVALTYAVGTPGNPLMFVPSFKSSFSLDKVHSSGGTCPTKATMNGSFDVFVKGAPAPEAVFIQS
jgi:hypothetical protein